MTKSLLAKYNIAAPRYTSYPTVPNWQIPGPGQEEWLLEVKKTYQEQGVINLYIHLPYCEQLCTYCGCNKRITKNHAVERPYIESVLKEWAMYVAALGEKPVIRELHLGGGTPTFFSPENLSFLVEGGRKRYLTQRAHVNRLFDYIEDCFHAQMKSEAPKGQFYAVDHRVSCWMEFGKSGKSKSGTLDRLEEFFWNDHIGINVLNVQGGGDTRQ